jgi:hypothetical protein
MSFEIFLFLCVSLHQLSFLNIQNRMFCNLHTLNVCSFEYALVSYIMAISWGTVVGGDTALQTGRLQV